jgi:MoxR-like ATPase
MNNKTTYEVGEQVQVTWESNPKCAGTLKSNHINNKRSEKICLPDLSGPGLKPKVGETWVCEIQKKTNPKSANRGAYIVRPLTLKMDYHFDDVYIKPSDLSAISITLQTPQMNLFLAGPQGVGKSTIVHAIAQKLGWKFRKIDCAVLKKIQAMYGRTIPVPKEGGGFDLVWKDSRLAKVLREAAKHKNYEYCVMLEEMTRMEPDCRDAWLEIIEGKEREFVMPTGEVIPIGNNIHFLAAGNLGESFTVQRQDAAFLDRFVMVKIYHMPQPDELQLCLKRFHGCPKNEMNVALTIINQLRKKYYDTNHPLSIAASTRGSQRVAMFLAKGMPVDLALKYAIVSQYSGDAANSITEAGRVTKMINDELDRMKMARSK